MFHGGESGRKTEYDNILVLERIVVQEHSCTVLQQPTNPSVR